MLFSFFVFYLFQAITGILEGKGQEVEREGGISEPGYSRRLDLMLPSALNSRNPCLWVYFCFFLPWAAVIDEKPDAPGNRLAGPAGFLH